MKVYRNLSEFNRLSYAVVTSGFFDGVHKGHQKILTRITDIARKTNGESVVVTFWPHPKAVLKPEEASPLVLSTLKEKTELIESCGIDHFVIIPFTKEFSQISSLGFVSDILVNTLGTKKLVIGYDHKFGRNREGSFEFLLKNCAQFGFEVEEISRQEVDDTTISSTIIRKSLAEGKVAHAAQFLGRYYSMEGTVVKGKQLGRTLGFPTANLRIDDPLKLIPKDGIYAVKVLYDKKVLDGMMSIGYNPTVDGNEKTIEVNLFDFSKDIYDENLKIYFVEYLREEEKFNSLEELKEQLKTDKLNSMNILAKTVLL